MTMREDFEREFLIGAVDGLKWDDAMNNYAPIGDNWDFAGIQNAAWEAWQAAVEFSAAKIAKLEAELASVTALHASAIADGLAMAKQIEERKYWRPCRGVPRDGCDYLAACGSLCNKCGQIHESQYFLQRA